MQLVDHRSTGAASTQINSTFAQATATLSSPTQHAATASAVVSFNAGGISATASLVTPESEMRASTSTAREGFTPSPTMPSPSSPPRLPSSTNTARPSSNGDEIAIPALPGTGPSQVGGLFDENAGVDHDRDNWTTLLSKLWPSLQEDLGSDWKLCLARFIDYEKHCGFQVISFILLASVYF